jgi:hypothetical protein
MYELALFINGVKVDQFKDESVTITDSIQNIRDIDKVFTAFTKTFNLPASKTNNQIFKHFYNPDIDNGFDARKKINARLELNTLPFRTGKVKLEGVNLKDRKAHTYRVTFFGDISKLKDRLGGDKLSDIELSQFDLDYSADEIFYKLITPVTGNTNIITPLITHTQRLYYNSGASTTDTGNLHYVNDNNHKGVKWNELKYAIRVNTILANIEAQYGLEFSTDFFRNQNVAEMHNIFLWLHRKSGPVEDLSDANTVETLVDFQQINYNQLFEIYNTSFCSLWTTQQLQKLELTVRPANAYLTTPYGVRIEENGITIYNSGVTLSGQQTFVDGIHFPYFGGCYEVYLETQQDMEFDTVRWYGEARFSPSSPVIIQSYFSPYLTASDVFTFNISKQMPDIKIIDFLTGLFKLFNLTAYVKDGIIVVQTLDDFYSEGVGHGLGNKGIDITEYVDTDANTVDAALPFREVYFKFEDTKTFLANKFGEITNRPWGQLSYTAGEENLDGGTYQIKAPFGHLLYERLNDINNGNLLDIQWGWNVNNDQSAYLGKPLLFYPIRLTEQDISLVNEVNDENVAIDHRLVQNVNMPFNTVELDPAVNNFQLNFFQEVNEWTRNENGKIFTGDLFSRYYSNYIESVFQSQQRLVTITAYLPISFLQNYKLSDRLIVADQQYKINSIKTNLKTGKSELELVIDRFVEYNYPP